MHTMTYTRTRDELNPMAANSAVAAGLSAAGDGSGRGGGTRQHMLEKSWNQDGGGHDHFHCHQEQEHQQQLQDLLGFCGIKGSTPKQLKRKRLADSMEQEESEAELVLELGQMVSSSRGFQDVRAGAGGSSNSSNSSILGLDRPSCNVLLQLGSMRDDSAAAMSIGEGVRQILDPAVVVVDNLDNVVTDLGIGPPPNPNLIAPHGPTRECELRASTSLLGLRQCDIIMENLLEGQIQVPVVDEESTSARLVSSGAGYMPSLLMNSHKLPTIAPSGMTYMQVTSTQQQAEKEEEEEEEEEEQGEEEEGEDQDVEQQEYPKSMRVSTSCGTTSTSGTSGHSERPRPKVCRFRGCSKGPRGASGLCIAHGGGRRCQKNGCNKGAEGRTVFCKAHGGGRRCQTLGCTKSAEGKTDYCIGHGGGRRCTHEGCSKAARGRSGLCIRHGGGKRCQIEGCTKSAEGYSGLCISHGGGRRCQFPACTKGAQGSTMFCKAHGGGKRCIIAGCNKGAEGSTPLCKGHGGGKRCLYDGGGICTKSVHGGTLYCVAHGGGKRCAVEGCAKSARGRTDFCVRHGGGKRCKVEGCGKSAQGSTDFCKAHGGGKRCQWGADQNGHVAFGNLSIYGDDLATSAALTMCDKFARGKTGLCVAHSGLVQDLRVQGGAAAAAAAHAFTPGPAPGLFRGWVSNSGQTQPTTNTSFSSSVTTAVAGGSEPAGSGSDWEMQGVQVGISHVSSTSDDSWAGRQSMKEQHMKSSYESMEHSNSDYLTSFKNSSSCHHSPFAQRSGSGSGNQSSQMAATHPTSSVGLGNFHSTRSCDLESPSSSQRSSSSSAGLLPFQTPSIPAQVLVPVSMQKETCSMYPLMYEQLNSITSEGVFNMSLSLPEGRVHGGRLQSLLRGGGGGGGGGQQQLKNTETELLGYDFTLGMRSSSSSLSSSIKMRQQQLQQPVNKQKTHIDAYNTVTAPMDNNQEAAVQQHKMMGHLRLEKVDLNRSLGGVDCNILATCGDLVNGVDPN